MSTRRLPVYLLLDTSGSMQGEPIHAVNVGLQSLAANLRQDPYALESVFISIVTFDMEVKEVVPLTALEDLQVPTITTPTSGATMMGAGLIFVCDKVAREIRKSTEYAKGDWRPLLFLMTDGKPSDTLAFQEVIPRVKAANFGTVVACAAGPKSDSTVLNKLTDKVVHMDTMNSASFSQFFQWVSSTINQGSSSMGAANSVTLPPPPPEIQIVI
jgi:uncharacterized protein YegL